MTAELVISLDFELMWGVHDHADRDSYGANILGGRLAIPKILALFERYAIRATWATVGFLFAESREDLLDFLPEAPDRPRYADPRLSNYSYLDSVGKDEQEDPFHFGLSLIRQIAATPGQEIGTHTLSHYYCLESGQTVSAFESDLRTAIAVARRHNISLRSIVFPRNQFDVAHLAVCQRLGLTSYRGNPTPWAYRASNGAEQTAFRRALRLIDAHSNILGATTYHRQVRHWFGAKTLTPESQFVLNSGN